MKNRIEVFSQTCLKSFEDEETCLAKFKGMWIDKTIPFLSNEAMDKGNYFEYLCIGDNAKDSEDIITDLPRKKNGDKKIDQIRIEEQAEYFRELFDKNNDNFLGYEIDNVQIEIWHPNGRDRGVVDFSTDWGKENCILWDLKLTSNVEATRHPKNWGHPDRLIDITQSLFYVDIYERNFGVRPEFRYLVFDYSTKKGVKLIKVNPKNYDMEEIDLRKETAINTINNMSDDEFTYNPSKWQCISCSLNCKHRVL